ncbi:MAG: type II toxin-antitoxin system antitoxin SocA domain-containing protein [Acidobacteriota bacterium]
MLNSANAVANYFLERAWDEGIELTPMKLLKLVYIAHGWYLAVYGGQPLLQERIQAWPYGPVIGDLYQQFKRFGNRPIDDHAYEFDGKFHERPKVALEDSEARAVLDHVWQAYKDYSAYQLSDMTHREGTPWHRVKEAHNGALPRNAVIPDTWIHAHYRDLGLAAKAAQDAHASVDAAAVDRPPVEARVADAADAAV